MLMAATTNKPAGMSGVIRANIIYSVTFPDSGVLAITTLAEPVLCGICVLCELSNKVGGWI